MVAIRMAIYVMICLLQWEVSAGVDAGTTWYWQLQGALKQNVNAKVYDVDLENTSTQTIHKLKAAGKTVICYYSAGSYENWRSDAGRFPKEALGRNLDGWPGEKWIDTRNKTVRAIMKARMELAQQKGCEGVEPDNVDGFSNNTGFPLTAATQMDFNRYLAATARSLGLLIALKNTTDLASALARDFDFAVVEECYKYNECSAYTEFVRQGKAVLIAEYSSRSASRCRNAKKNQFSLAFFNLDLNGKKFQPCP